ncbi:MAG TPA: DUF5672 family protein [Hymenobacter sp.]|jgi:hypothetical protein
MKTALVTVVIPIYQEKPSELEIISLDQTLAVLHEYPITFMTPTRLDVAWYEDYCRGKATVYFERFEWSGYVAFNDMMVAPAFYQRFLRYQYMLICHLDAFVFRNELAKWCRLGYDYTGSVLYNGTDWDQPDTLLRRLTGFTTPEYYACGGFALKNVAAFYRITHRSRLYIRLYRAVQRLRHSTSLVFDDLFVTRHFPKLSAKFRMAPKAQAERFGAACMKLDAAALPFDIRNDDDLPFGVHGWIQGQELWADCIRRSGYPVPAAGRPAPEQRLENQAAAAAVGAGQEN